MFSTITLLWIAFAPLGYIAYRWFYRNVDSRWTRNDRLFAIFLSVFYGPLMLVILFFAALINKLLSSNWGNKEVRW